MFFMFSAGFAVCATISCFLMNSPWYAAFSAILAGVNLWFGWGDQWQD